MFSLYTQVQFREGKHCGFHPNMSARSRMIHRVHTLPRGVMPGVTLGRANLNGGFRIPFHFSDDYPESQHTLHYYDVRIVGDGGMFYPAEADSQTTCTPIPRVLPSFFHTDRFDRYYLRYRWLGRL